MTYTKAIDEVRKSMPKASIFVNGIIPRHSQKDTWKIYNEKVLTMNQFLKEYADEHEDTTYIANSNTFKDKDCGHLYQKGDTSGIHLNKDGQQALMDIIAEAIQKKSGSTKRGREQSSPLSTEKDLKNRRITLDSSGSVN